MTNTEKFKKIFGFLPDEYPCLFHSCMACKYYGKDDCKNVWWEEEYKQTDAEVVNLPPASEDDLHLWNISTINGPFSSSIVNYDGR